MKRTSLIVAVLLLSCAPLAAADTLRTKSGEVFKGRILEEATGHVRLRTAFGELTVPRAEIDRHERAAYVVELQDGTTLEGEITGENEKVLTLKAGGESRPVPLADVKTVTEKKPPPPEKKPPPKRLSPAEIQALHQRTLEHFKNKEYDKAIAECTKVLESDPEDPTALYNIACAHSMLKEKAKALEFLRKSLEAGFANFDHLEQDSDLDNIRDEEGYKELINSKAEYIRKATEKAVARISKALADRGVDAKRYKSVLDQDRNFVYLHTKSDDELAAVRKDLEAYAERQWKNLFQNPPKQPLYIVLLTPGDSQKVFRGRAGGVYNPAANTLLCGDIPALRLMKTSVIIHEFTHALHFADMFARRQQHPIWLIEGLATLFESSEERNGEYVPHHNYRLAVVQAAVRTSSDMPWKNLMGVNHLQFMSNARLAYAQSRYMLLYMHERGLLKKFYDEYTDNANYASDRTALESFEVVFGKPIESVERDWRQWVLRQSSPPLPFLGVQTKDEAEKVVVTLVAPGSPAAKAGVKNGDTIAAIEGEPIRSTSDLMDAVGKRKVGDEVEVEVVRGEEKLTVKAKLAERGGAPPPPQVPAYLGLTVEQKDGAVYAKEVDKGSPAEKAGIDPGEAVLEFNRAKVSSVRDFLAALRKTRPGQKVEVKLKKGEEERLVAVELAEQPPR